jgi:hypothetical protein
MRRGVASVAAAGVVGALAVQLAGAGLPAAAASAPVAASAAAIAHPQSGSSGGPGSSTTTTVAGGNAAPSENPLSDVYVPAFGPSTSLQLDQAWMMTALSDRQSRLSELAGDVSSSKTLASGDASSLSGLISNDQGTLSQLQSAVPGATSTSALRSEAAQMIALHVFAALTPQVQDTINAEAVGAAAAKLVALEPGLNTAIAAAHASPRQIARLQQLEQSFAADAGNAAGLVAPLPGELVALNDASLPAAQPVLSSAQSATQRGQRALVQAGTELRRLLSQLAQSGLSSHFRVRLRDLQRQSGV